MYTSLVITEIYFWIIIKYIFENKRFCANVISLITKTMIVVCIN